MPGGPTIARAEHLRNTLGVSPGVPDFQKRPDNITNHAMQKPVRDDRNGQNIAAHVCVDPAHRADRRAGFGKYSAHRPEIVFAGKMLRGRLDEREIEGTIKMIREAVQNGRAHAPV